MTSNGISHAKVAPYHPSSNGLAERAVQIFKRNMERQTEDKTSKILFNYRTTPHSTTTTSPAQLLMERKLKTHLDLLHPDLQKKVENSVQRQKYSHDQHARVRPSFKEGDKVYIRNFSDGGRWIEVVVIIILGPLSYLVKLPNGIEVKRHINHIRNQIVSSTHLQMTHIVTHITTRLQYHVTHPWCRNKCQRAPNQVDQYKGLLKSVNLLTDITN